MVLELILVGLGTTLGYLVRVRQHRCVVQLEKVVVGGATLQAGDSYHLPNKKECRVVERDSGQVAFEGGVKEGNIVRDSMIAAGFDVVMFVEGVYRG